MTRLTRLDPEEALDPKEAIAVNQALVLLLNRRVDNERQARPYNHLRNGLLNPPILDAKKEELFKKLDECFTLTDEQFNQASYLDLCWPYIEYYFESALTLTQTCYQIGLPPKAIMEGLGNYALFVPILSEIEGPFISQSFNLDDNNPIKEKIEAFVKKRNEFMFGEFKSEENALLRNVLIPILFYELVAAYTSRPDAVHLLPGDIPTHFTNGIIPRMRMGLENDPVFKAGVEKISNWVHQKLHPETHPFIDASALFRIMEDKYKTAKTTTATQLTATELTAFDVSPADLEAQGADLFILLTACRQHTCQHLHLILQAISTDTYRHALLNSNLLLPAIWLDLQRIATTDQEKNALNTLLNTWLYEPQTGFINQKKLTYLLEAASLEFESLEHQGSDALDGMDLALFNHLFSEVIDPSEKLAELFPDNLNSWTEKQIAQRLYAAVKLNLSFSDAVSRIQQRLPNNLPKLADALAYFHTTFVTPCLSDSTPNQCPKSDECLFNINKEYACIHSILTNCTKYVSELLAITDPTARNETLNTLQSVVSANPSLAKSVAAAVNIKLQELNKDTRSAATFGVAIGAMTSTLTLGLLIATSVFAAVVFPILIAVAVLAICVGIAVLISHCKQKPEREKLHNLNNTLKPKDAASQLGMFRPKRSKSEDTPSQFAPSSNGYIRQLDSNSPRAVV